MKFCKKIRFGCLSTIWSLILIIFYRYFHVSLNPFFKEPHCPAARSYPEQPKRHVQSRSLATLGHPRNQSHLPRKKLQSPIAILCVFGVFSFSLDLGNGRYLGGGGEWCGRPSFFWPFWPSAWMPSSTRPRIAPRATSRGSGEEVKNGSRLKGRPDSSVE